MEYLKHIKVAIEYIESNLNEKLTVSSCAQACGYSDYYFLRIFKCVTGHTPMNYVRKRRLSEAAKELLDSRKSIIDIALKWGFDSAENFIRAFQTEHGITPGSYKRQKNSLHLFAPYENAIYQHNLNLELEPQLEQKNEFIHWGYPFITGAANRHNAIPKSWNRYYIDKLGNNLRNTCCSNDHTDVGLLEKCADGTCRYTIGIITNSPGPQGTVKTVFPPALYLVFETPPSDSFTFVENIHSTWDYIYLKWLPRSQYRQAGDFVFECSYEESTAFREKIYIPVTKK